MQLSGFMPVTWNGLGVFYCLTNVWLQFNVYVVTQGKRQSVDVLLYAMTEVIPRVRWSLAQICLATINALLALETNASRASMILEDW